MGSYNSVDLSAKDPNDEREDAAEDTQTIHERVHKELDLVDIIASQVSRRIGGAVEFDELLAAGREGLFNAARRFDETRGIPFRAYANYRIEGAIVDAVRKSLPVSRRTHERLSMLEAVSHVTEGESYAALRDASSDDREAVLDEQLASAALAVSASALAIHRKNDKPEATEDGDPEALYCRAELLENINDAMAELDAPEAEVLRLYYFEGMTFELIAETMNISKTWAFRLHSRAVARLSKRLRGYD
jgi:RNA polymerase sigma factor for flagellar operon FliA